MPSDYRPPEQAAAALEEFSLRLAPLGEVDSPTPGKIADQLCEITEDLEAGITGHSRTKVLQAVAWLRRLRLALDAWDTWATLTHVGALRDQSESEDSGPAQAEPGQGEQGQDGPGFPPGA